MLRGEDSEDTIGRNDGNRGGVIYSSLFIVVALKPTAILHW